MITQQFIDVTDYLDYCESPVDADTEYLGRTSQENRRSWGGEDTFERVLELGRKGWPEGLAKVHQFTTSLKSTLDGMIPVKEIEYRSRPAGSLAMGRFLTGQPNIWLRTKDSAMTRESSTAKIVRIVMNTCVSGAMADKTLYLRGAAVAALVYALEKHRYRCVVDLVAANAGGSGFSWGRGLPPTIETWVRIKESYQSLQLDKLIFILGHPGSFRKLMFSCWEHLPLDVRKKVGIRLNGGYGLVTEATDKGDIYLPGLETGIGQTEEECIKWITEQLEAQGIVVEKKD